jgi:hypothetical protein
MLIEHIISITAAAAPTGPAIRFRNYYECTHDQTKWHDAWTCMCNDRCPTCDTEAEPHFSEDIEANA